ncbi:unnamed protein product [Trichobilharzia szidati]|nr:unnamed protein product [Trichobilharzia szidati]
MRMTSGLINHTSNNVNANNSNNGSFISTSTPLITPNGKRRGRKPGLNSTVAQRSAANARERSRMRVLSGAFVELKGALPWVPKDTKLSKLDTLKLAAGYIAYLRRILDTSESSTTNSSPPPSVPNIETVEESGLIRNASALKLLHNEACFQFTSKVCENTLPETIKLFNLVTNGNNNNLKKPRVEEHSKYGDKNERSEGEGEGRNGESSNQVHCQRQQYTHSDHCTPSYPQRSHFPNEPYRQSQPHHPYTMDRINFRQSTISALSPLSLPPPSQLPISLTQPTTDIQFPINRSLNDCCINPENNNDTIYYVGCVNSGALTTKDNTTVVYPELYSNQYGFSASLSCYLDNFYGKDHSAITNETIYFNDSDSLDDNGIHSLAHNTNEKSREGINLLKLKNNFYPKLTHLIKPPVELLTSDANVSNEILSTSKTMGENDSYFHTMYTEYQKTDLDLSLSSSSSIETSALEINDECMFTVKSNPHPTNLHLSRKINNEIS